MSTINLIVGTQDVSSTITPTESFTATIVLAGGAADVSVALGTLTVPRFVAVYCATPGVSFKIGALGTDSVPADPFAIMCCSTGQAVTALLLSNSSGSAATVLVFAEE